MRPHISTGEAATALRHLAVTVFPDLFRCYAGDLLHGKRIHDGGANAASGYSDSSPIDSAFGVIEILIAPNFYTPS